MLHQADPYCIKKREKKLVGLNKRRTGLLIHLPDGLLKTIKLLSNYKINVSHRKANVNNA